MEEALDCYNRGRYGECLRLYNELPDPGDLLESLVRENNMLVCESVMKISNNETESLFEIQKLLHSFFEKVNEAQVPESLLLLQLKVTAAFNCIFWLLFYNFKELHEIDTEEYLFLLHLYLLKVLGRRESLSESCSLSNKIFNCLCDLKILFPEHNPKTVCLIVELIIVVLLNVFKLRKNLVFKCAKVTGDLISELKQTGIIALQNSSFLQLESKPLCLFKFGFNKTASFFDELNFVAMDYLYLLESVFLHLSGDCESSLKSLQKNINSTVRGLWHYIGMLNSYEIGNWNLCESFVLNALSEAQEPKFQARYHIIQGKLHGVKKNHKEAIRNFEMSLHLSPGNPVCYYYIGLEYGKIGLYDLMSENFNKLVMVLNEDGERDIACSLDVALLDFVHPWSEISQTEALYALAVSYGLQERFEESAEIFEKLFKSGDLNKNYERKRIAELPNFLTILHEASVMNLLAGNLSKAEQIAQDAAERFVANKPSLENPVQTNSEVRRDMSWLQNLIHCELLETHGPSFEHDENVVYSEDTLGVFPRNVTALLVISEVQRIQEAKEYKSTLGLIISLLSTFMASICRKEAISKKERCLCTLVKVLMAKTCMKAAAALMKEGDEASAEKMLKRALSCNEGDKEALCRLYRLLNKTARRKEALKLWRTFCNKKAILCADDVKGLSLRYFLQNNVKKRELEKIEAEVQEGVS